MLDSHAFAPGETQITVVTYAALHTTCKNKLSCFPLSKKAIMFLFFTIGFLFFLLVKGNALRVLKPKDTAL